MPSVGCLLHGLVGFLAVSAGCLLLYQWPNQSGDRPRASALDQYLEQNPQIGESLGSEGLRIFRQHDRDEDGVLSPKEFAPLVAEIVEERRQTAAERSEQFDGLSGELDHTSFEVICSMRPFNFSSLKTKVDDPSATALKGLADWIKPHTARRRFRHEAFRQFLPPTAQLTTVGSAWYLVKSVSGTGATSSSSTIVQLSSNRYWPPPVHPEERTLNELLAMFHPRPFVYPRFAPQGTLVMVRAASEDSLDLVFRSHAEFQLNVPPLYPLWFTPSQFRGRLTISRDAALVHRLDLRVPDKRRLNVDLEWLTAAGRGGDKEGDTLDNMEVDIGHIGDMRLRANLPEPAPQMMWTDAIEVDDAFDRLEKLFYPFTQVPYYPFAQALQRASQERKLVHSVVLWGALDDQSC